MNPVEAAQNAQIETEAKIVDAENAKSKAEGMFNVAQAQYQSSKVIKRPACNRIIFFCIKLNYYIYKASVCKSECQNSSNIDDTVLANDFTSTQEITSLKFHFIFKLV